VVLVETDGEKRWVTGVRLHDLRHSCASFLLAQGASPRVVMEILGHSGIAVTMNTYAHVLPTLLGCQRAPKRQRARRHGGRQALDLQELGWS
jgi:integrase